MPLDVLGYTRATMTSSTSDFFLVRKDVGNLFNARRDGARFLQLLIFNEESLVCASHQLAQNASLSFVHTARRSYRLDDPARRLELNFLCFGKGNLTKLFKPYRLEEAEVVTRSP
jgi:hypothetical protein